MATLTTTKESRYEVFEREFFPYLDALTVFARHLTHHEEDANDLVQETFMKAYKSAEKFTVGTNAKAWLFTICKNAFINHYRKRQRMGNQVALEGYTTFRQVENGMGWGGHSDLRDDIFNQLMGDEVTLSIRSLPIDFRTVLLLADVDDFTYEEIADMLQIPIGTVRSRLFRARNLLKSKLQSYATAQGFEDKRK